MKLTEKNARFAVVRTAFHRGGTVSFHRSLQAAERAARRARVGECCCGCCGVVPVTVDAWREMHDAPEWWYAYDERRLYADLPDYDGSQDAYQYCK